MKKIFWNSKAPNVGLVDHAEEGLKIVTLLGLVFVPSMVTIPKRDPPNLFFQVFVALCGF